MEFCDFKQIYYISVAGGDFSIRDAIQKTTLHFSFKYFFLRSFLQIFIDNRIIDPEINKRLLSTNNIYWKYFSLIILFRNRRLGG